MPKKDSIHQQVRVALERDGWVITHDPYVISYGERFLFVDIGAERNIIMGAERGNERIAVEIKVLKGVSVIVELEQAIGQYQLYRLLLDQLDSERKLFLAIPYTVYQELFYEPIGRLIITQLPLRLIVIDIDKMEIEQWIS